MPNRNRPPRPRPDGVGEDSFSYAEALGISPQDLAGIRRRDPETAEGLTSIRAAGSLTIKQVMKWGGFPTPEAAQQFLREAAANGLAGSAQDDQESAP
jgi:hypothetical protein